MCIPRNLRQYALNSQLVNVLWTVLEPENPITATVGSHFSGSVVAKDAFGYSLTYFTDDNDSTNTFLGDYKSIESSSFLGKIYHSPLINTSRNLYNGNIKHMVTAIGEFMKNGESPQATVYHYDQLNRLTNMNTFASFNFSNQSWNSGSLSDNYQNSFTYDANGNILTQYRKTAKSSNKVQDQLTYHYQPHTNQLTYVSDAVDQNHYTNDIDDQSSGNYVYDEIGNLVKDKSESIDTILWNVYGKIKEIRRVDTSSKPWLAFEYNPSGQRAVKIVKPDHNDQLSWIYTYYIYDATGNVMATYTRRNYFDDIGDSSFAFVNDWIYNELGLTDLQDFMESKFSYNSQFINDWIEFLSTNELAAGVFDEFSPDDFLGWDATLVPAVLSNFAHSPNASPTENDALLNAILSNQQSNFVSSVLNSGTAVLNNALTGILSNDPTDLLLNCMATNNPVGLNSVYVSLGGSPTPPPTNASRIAYIRSFPPPTIASQISAIESISNLQNYFSSCLNSTMIYNSWNSSQPNISFTDLFDAWSGLGDTSLILDVLQNHYSNDARLRILLKEVRTLQQLYQLASSSNYSSFVSNSINATSYQDLSFVMYQSSALTFSSYLKLVRIHFGTTNYSSMMADIGEWLKFGKDILLQEQHIYGSTRLGMYQSNQLLVKYKYKYSDTLQIYLDSVKFDRDTNRAMRKLSHKQYELTNHLGNVLSTVLDRKTPITSSGGSGGSGGSTTITHFGGDVVFASDYYPFGSPMTWTTSDSSGDRLCSGCGYRFGFNGKENDRETQTQYFDFRTYFQKLGRFSSVDPLVMLAPDKTPYHFVSNNPINRIDPLGLTDYYVDGEIRRIDDGHKGVSIKVSEEQFNELQRKFERGSSGYEKSMNRMSVQNGFQTYSDFGEEYTDADGIYHHIGVSITVHKAGGDSYSDWSKNKSLDNIGQVNDVVDNIGGSLGANAGLTRLGTNGKLYFETPNGGVFRGNQYVSTTSIAKYGSKIGRVTGPVGYAISAGQIGYGVYRDGGQFGYNAQVATGGAVGGTLGGMAGAWAGAKTFGAAGLLIGGPVGGAIGGVIGGIVGGVAGGYYGGEFGEQVVK